MRWPFSIVSNDEIIRALRCNVADLQDRLNRTKRYVGNVENRGRKLRDQVRRDQAYIDRVKEAADALMALVARGETDTATAVQRLDDALHGRPIPQEDTTT